MRTADLYRHTKRSFNIINLQIIWLEETKEDYKKYFSKKTSRNYEAFRIIVTKHKFLEKFVVIHGQKNARNNTVNS